MDNQNYLRRVALRTFTQEEDGFSLTELMVVIVIIGILALIALPRFMNVTVKAKMTEATMMLKQLHTLQQAHYYERDAYATSLDMLGFEQEELTPDGGTARYVIAIESADPAGYRAIATSVIDFDKDGTFNVWEVDDTGKIVQRTAD